MPDLYETLGVAHDATRDAIKAAYRKLAKKHHPDAGGEPEKFTAVAVAYKVLSDDAARQKYDETGEIDGPEKSSDAAALAIIGGLVDELTNRIVTSDNLQHTDLVADLVKKVDERIRSIREDRKQAEKFELKATKLRKRFKAKKGPDYLGQMLETKIANCRRAIANAQSMIADLERAREILSDAEFTVEPGGEFRDPWQGGVFNVLDEHANTRQAFNQYFKTRGF